MDLKKKRWLILVASMLINLCIGSGYAWSVYAGPLAKYAEAAGLDWTQTAIALTFTISNLVGPIPMIIGGGLQDKFGPKWVIFGGGILFGGGLILAGFLNQVNSIVYLYICYGIITGLGMGFVYGCTIANTVKFFPDKRGMVAGLSTGAYGFGPVIVAPLMSSLIASNDVFFTFKVMGLIFLIVILVGSFFVQTAPAGYKPEGWNPPAPTSAAGAVATVDKKWTQMLADPLFYLLLIMLVLGTTSGLMIVSQVSPIAQQVIKVDASTAAFIVSIVAFANMCGRILWGMVSDKIGRYPSLILMYIISAVAMFCLTMAGEGQMAIFVVCVIFAAICFGGTMGVFPALTADTFGPKNNGVNYGFMFIGFAIGGTIGPMVAAGTKVTDAAGVVSYSTAFIIAAVMSLCGILVTFLVMQMKKKAASAK